MFKFDRLKFIFFHIWPPFIGSGIRFKIVQKDPMVFEVKLELTWYNRNYVGTQYGGSLYSMADPWFMLILINSLGKDFLVWDKAATIRFMKPSKSTVSARFEIDSQRISEIRQRAMSDGKHEPVFTVSIFDDKGQEVAQVDKVLWVKYKTK